MKWIKDQRVEHHLKRLGITFEVLTFEIKNIDLEESANRQVRLGKKINDDWVLEYAEGMQQPGAAFPMPILNKLKNFVFIWSGNHRVRAAHLVGETTLEAYAVSITDPRLSDILPRIVNAWEGHRPTREELLLNAQHLIETHRMDVKDAGKLLGLKYEWISQHMRAVLVSKKIQEQGVNPNGFTRTTLVMLSPLQESVNVLREITRFLKKYEVVGDDAKAVINDVKRKETEAQRIAEVERWEKIFQDRHEPQETVKVPFNTSVRRKFLSYMTSLRKVLEEATSFSQLQIPPEEVEKVVEYWTVIDRQMTKILRGKGDSK